MNRFLSAENSRQFLQNLQILDLPWQYDPEKHRIIILDDNGNEKIIFRLPITLPAPDPNLQFSDQTVHYIILLIQSGSCALGYFENGQNLDHKVFRAYMVRKKRGVSQIKHLKTKGKSRAGSRVRLAETEEFFDHINQRLQSYFSDHSIDRIAISLPKILMPYFYQANISTPFQKADPRLLKIPKHIHTPIYEVLLNTNRFLQKGELIFEPEEEALVTELIRDLT